MPVATPGEGPEGPARPLILDQTKARRAENIFFATPPPNPRLSQGLDDRPGSAAEGGFGEWSQWFSIRVSERLPSSKKTYITVNPPLSTQGSLFISSPFEPGGGGLNRDGGIISFRKDDGISSNNGKEM